MPTSLKQIAAELFFRDRTGEAAASVAKNAKQIDTAVGGAATAFEKTEKASASTERAYARLQRKIAPLAAATERFERDQRTLADAQAIGRINAEQYRDQLRSLERQFERTKDRIQGNTRAQRELTKETNRFSSVANAAKGVVAGFVAAFSFREIISGAREAVSEFDKIAKASRSLGGIETAGFLQSSRFALGQLGFSESETDKILTTLNKRVGELAAGFGALKQPIERINPELAELLTNARTAEERFDIFVGGLEQIEDAGERAALAAAAFDASFGKRFGAAIEAGADGIQELRKQAEELGLIVDVELLKRAEALNDEFAITSQILSVEIKSALVELGPIILELTRFAAEFTRRLTAIPDRFRFQLGGVDALTSETQLRRVERDLQTQLDANQNLAGIFRNDGAISRLEADLQKVREALNVFETTTLGASDGVKNVDQVLSALTMRTEEFNREQEKRNAALRKENAAAAKKTAEERAGEEEALRNRRASVGGLVAQNAQSRLDFIGADARARQVSPAEFERLIREGVAEGVRNLELNRDRGTADIRVNQSIAELEARGDEIIKEFKKANRSLDQLTVLGRAGEIAEALTPGLDQIAFGFDDLSRAFENIGGGIVNSIRGIAGGAGNLFNGIADFGAGLADSFGGVLGAFGSQLQGLFSSLGPIGQAIGAAAGVVSSLINFIGSIFGNRTGVVDFDLARQTPTFTQQARNDDVNAARDQIADAAVSEINRLVDLIGADFIEGIGLNVFARSNEAGVALVDSATRQVISAFARSTPDDVSGLAREAVKLVLEGAVEGGNDLLRDVAIGLLDQGNPVDEVVDKLTALRDAIDGPAEELDKFQERLNAIRDAFDGLDLATSGLAEAFDQAIDRLAANVNEENARALTELRNPLLGDVRERLNALDARRQAVLDIAGEGGAVDLTLLETLAREQILGLFNIEQRLNEAIDPVAFSVQELRRNQRLELEAIREAISRGLLSALDEELLLRTQAAERAAFVRGLSDEDRLRLAEELGDFEDLGGRYALLLTQLNEMVQDRLNEFDRVLADAEAKLSDRTRRFQAAEQGLLDFDREFFGGSPGQNVDILRDQAIDIVERAIADPDNVLARDNAFRAVNDFVSESERVNVSSGDFFADRDLGRDLLQRFTDQLEQEAADAQAERDAILESRDYLRDIRDFAAGDRVDAAGLDRFADLFGPNDPLTEILRDLADLSRAQFEQNERITDVLAGIGPDQIGLAPTDSLAQPTVSLRQPSVTEGNNIVAFPTQPNVDTANSAEDELIETMNDVSMQIADLLEFHRNAEKVRSRQAKDANNKLGQMADGGGLRVVQP